MDVWTDVSDLAGRYRAACSAREVALAELLSAVRLAVEAGAVKDQAIRVSGLARQTVYDALR